MQYTGTLLVSKDLDKTKAFYKNLFGLDVILDYGANVTLTGGFSFQTLESWACFIDKDINDILFKHHCGELYFEDEDLDNFMKKVLTYQVPLVHDIKTFDWGQRCVRVYDPDMHVIEVGEPMPFVVKRFLAQGLSIEETSKKSMIPVDVIKSWMND